VTLTYRNDREGALALTRELTRSGTNAEAVPLDATDIHSIRRAFTTFDRNGRSLYAMAYLPAARQNAYLRYMTNEAWDNVLDVCLTGCFRCMREAARIMAQGCGGRIVVVSSDAACLGSPMRANYSAAKAGIEGLTKAAAMELAPRAITVNCISPGLVDTERTRHWPRATRERLLRTIPARRLATVQDVAGAMAFLVAEDAGYITGQILRVNGGMCM
jgi:3-oxoacyl-[acyl-carrier protein] reductase